MKKGKEPAGGQLYTREEFAAAAGEEFGLPSECVLAALIHSGVALATRAKAKQLVKQFIDRKVG